MLDNSWGVELHSFRPLSWCSDSPTIALIVSLWGFELTIWGLDKPELGVRVFWSKEEFQKELEMARSIEIFKCEYHWLYHVTTKAYVTAVLVESNEELIAHL